MTDKLKRLYEVIPWHKEFDWWLNWHHWIGEVKKVIRLWDCLDYIYNIEKKSYNDIEYYDRVVNHILEIRKDKTGILDNQKDVIEFLYSLIE